MKITCRRCTKLIEVKREDTKYCGDACRQIIHRVKKAHSEIKDNVDDLVKFLEATSLRDLEAAGIFTLAWKRNGTRTMREAQSHILDAIEKVGGTFTYQGCRITI